MICTCSVHVYTCFYTCLVHVSCMFHTCFVHVLYICYACFTHVLDMFWTCSRKVWRVKNYVFPKSFWDLWAMFWHHPWCLRAGQQFKKLTKHQKIKCSSEAPESYLKSFALIIEFRALFSHWFMHFFIFLIFHIFPIFPLFISDIFNPEGCSNTNNNTNNNNHIFELVEDVGIAWITTCLKTKKTRVVKDSGC